MVQVLKEAGLWRSTRNGRLMLELAFVRARPRGSLAFAQRANIHKHVRYLAISYSTAVFLAASWRIKRLREEDLAHRGSYAVTRNGVHRLFLRRPSRIWIVWRILWLYVRLMINTYAIRQTVSDECYQCSSSVSLVREMSQRLFLELEHSFRIRIRGCFSVGL